MKTDRVGLTLSISSTTKPETQSAATSERSAVRNESLVLFPVIVITFQAKIKTGFLQAYSYDYGNLPTHSESDFTQGWFIQ
ncbi:MAG: hypothetical protein KGL67_01255 [Patescibacteria group bacterium]|nr:hypothetical protein [Patescibacteria group bacterium]